MDNKSIKLTLNFLVLMAFITALPAFAENTIVKTRQFPIPGVGQVRVVQDIVGEPIAMPERLQIYLKCGSAKKEIRLKVFRMCKLENYSYEKESKTLNLTLALGQVNPKSGNVDCNIRVLQSVEFEKACAANPAK